MTILFRKTLKLRSFLSESWPPPLLVLFSRAVNPILVFADASITEFLAEKDGCFLDEDGDARNWITLIK